MARASAERMFRSHFPDATIEPQRKTGLSIGRYYLVRVSADAWDHAGSGDTKPKAWAAACRRHGIAALKEIA